MVNNKALNFDGLQNFVAFGEPEKDQVVMPNRVRQSTMVMDVLQIQKTNLFFTNSTLVLDDHPWKMGDFFLTENNFFEYVRQTSFHENANTAFGELSDD